MKRALLEGTDKRKSKSKEASADGQEAESSQKDPSPARLTIQPLDDATQQALKKKSKRRDSEVPEDPVKPTKTKRASKEVGTTETLGEQPSASPSKRRESNERSSDSESSPAPRKSKRGSQPRDKSVPHLPAVVPALPPILSDRSTADDGPKPPATPPSLPPPLTPGSSAIAALAQAMTGSPKASPRPFGSPRVSGVSPRPFDQDLPLPPPLEASPGRAAHGVSPLPPPPPMDDEVPPPPLDRSESPPPPPPATDVGFNLTPLPSEIPVHHLPPTDSIQSALPVAQIAISGSSASLGGDSEEEPSDTSHTKEHKDKKKKKHRGESVNDSGEGTDSTSTPPTSKHTRERSGTKSRRDSVSLGAADVTPLSFNGVPSSSNTLASPPSARGAMRLNRTPRGENVISPRGQIIIVTPRGEVHTEQVVSSASALSVVDPLSQSSNSTHRDSVDSSDDPSIGSLKSSFSGSMSEVPPPPPPPTVGLAPPPPPMPTNRVSGASRTTRSGEAADSSVEENMVAKARSRRVVPAVEAAVKAWDFRATNFEQHLAREVARKSAPEELLEFPHDDLLLEMVHSPLQHYPELDEDAPQSVKDAYASYTSQLKMIHRQSQWYGTETSQKDRVKEYEIRQARAKQEAEKVAAAAQAPPGTTVEIKTSSKNVADKTRRPSSLSRSGSGADQPQMTRRASRAIKLTTAADIPASDPVASSLPDLTEDDDSSAQDSGEESGAEIVAPSPEVQVHGSPAAAERKPSGKADKGPGSAKRPKLAAQHSDMGPGLSAPASARGLPGDPIAGGRPSSPDARRTGVAGTLRPSSSKGDTSIGGSAPNTPPKLSERPRLSSRSLSGVAGSSIELGSGQATFALNPKMMTLDEKTRRKEAEKADEARKGIFEVFTPLSISSEPSDHVQQVEPLRPKVDARIMLHFKNIRLGLGYEEPFFISAAFYDIEKRIRLSETFYVDFNDQNELLKSLLSQFYGPAEPESQAKRFLANLTYHSPSIYLIIRVNTVLHGDIDDVADPYSGGSTSSRDKQKMMDSVRQATSLMGRLHQGFGWAAMQIFDERSNFKLNDENTVTLNKMKNPLSDAALFDFLTSEEKVKPKVLDATLSIGAFMCTRDKFQLLKCVDSSLVHWPPEQAPSLEQKNDKAGAILKSLVKPPTPITDIVREIDIFEQPFDKPAPYWSHVHNLYLYPQSFNLASSKIKAKTVVARIYLMRSDDGVDNGSVPAIFSRCSDKNLTNMACTSVWWESSSAPLWDEIKIKLPHRLTESYHLLFVLSSVNVKVLSKKKEGANEPPETPLAYAWMNVREHGLFLKDNEYVLPWIAAPANGQIRDYLSYRETEFIDTDKATFTLRTRLVSTVATQDENLGHYFSEYDKMSQTEKSIKERKKMFDYITKADSKVVLKFFPVLFNQLFLQLCSTKSNSLQQSIFRVIVTLAQRVFDLTMVSGKLSVSDALYAYAIQYFDLPPKSLHNPADVIAANWVVLLETAAGAKALADAGITPSAPLEEKLTPAEQSELSNLANFSLKDVSWFLFELIFKSLVLNMASNGNGSRKGITSPALQQSITRLVQFVDLHRRGVGSGFDHINRVLARTFNRLFSLTDRGFVLDLIYNHLVKLEGDHSATVFRFRFLQIVTDYEHYVQLNLPVYTPIDSLEVTPTKFWQQHYLAGLYLNELRNALLAGEESKITRSKAIARFRDLLWKHHLDDRYQNPESRARIAGMYFPLLMLLVEKVQMLIEKTQKDEMERTEWCLCGLWIFRYMNRETQLRSWWRGESTENLVNTFQFLKYCLDTFQNDEPMREEIIYLMAEVYDLFMDDLDEELKTDGSKVMEAFSLSMIHLLRVPKSEKLTLRLLQIVRTYVIKFKRPLFRYLASYTICGDLTFEVFHLCQSQPKRVMQNATSVLYLMLRTNNDEMGHFARMKLQSTSAVSRLVKSAGCNYDEIRNGLEAMALYKDGARATSWDNQIREFINRHARIIRDNIRSAATPPSFADKKAEIYYQISLEYVYSPDLRITWLSNLAQHHESGGSLLEAAICKVQIAALVAEYLTQVLALKQPVRGVPDDSAVFSHAFPTIKEEKSFSVIWLEGNTILSPSFSEDGFVKALNEAVDLFIRAEDYEGAAEVQLILANYFKENKRWEQLAPLGTQIATNSQRLYETNRMQSRVPPNFYRVAFFGKGFEEDDGKEYLYRVNPSMRLADFTAGLDERYIEKFGADCYERLGNKPIEEYEHVDLTKKNYLQIVNCEIYYEYEHLSSKDRLTYSDRSFDVKKFCFETPYSPGGGKPSEEVSKTWKRKIVLTPARTFPYLLTRVPIRKKDIKILKPIESAIDLLLGIVTRLKEALNCTPPNTKTVQIILQGSVLTQVNAGPLAIIREFLGNAANYTEAEVAKVAEQVRGFVRRCKFGFALNATLIEKEPSLAPLHEEMSKAFKVLVAEAQKHIEL